jgi:membrane protein DedA with SNARE-associated domain
MKDRPERRPTPPPLETNEVAIAVTGTLLWALGLVVLAVFFRGNLQRHDASWWLWACGLGVVLGLYGLRFALRRRRH